MMDNNYNYNYWKKQKEDNFYGGSRSRSQNNRRSSFGNGQRQQSVLSLEKKFCAIVGGVSWKQVLDTQKYMHQDEKVLQWKDSAVQEAFWNAKKRFLAKMQGQPCDIKLPDPDIFIDKIDWDSSVDPELLLDLDKRDAEIPCMTEKDSGVVVGIPVVPEQFALTPMGWGDAESQAHQQLNKSDRHDTNGYGHGYDGWGEENGVNNAEKMHNGGSTWNGDHRKKRWGDHGGYNKKWYSGNGGRNSSRFKISRYHQNDGNGWSSVNHYGSNSRGNFSIDERPLIQWKPVSRQW